MFFSILSILYYRALLTILIDFFNYIDLKRSIFKVSPLKNAKLPKILMRSSLKIETEREMCLARTLCIFRNTCYVFI